MFLVKAGTVIQIEAPKSQIFWHTSGWVPYTTKEDKLYDSEEVWDAVGVHNGRDNIPYWAELNIKERGWTVIKRAGKYAMVGPGKIEYLD